MEPLAADALFQKPSLALPRRAGKRKGPRISDVASQNSIPRRAAGQSGPPFAGRRLPTSLLVLQVLAVRT